MPNASAPNAPCVLVWLSPQTMVMPGWVRPSSGPMTCTMPCPLLPRACSSMPKSAQFFSSCGDLRAAALSSTGILPSLPRGVVGVEWSIVATVRVGRRTLSPVSRSQVKAWGEVTSWIRCRST